LKVIAITKAQKEKGKDVEDKDQMIINKSKVEKVKKISKERLVSLVNSTLSNE